MGNRDKAADSSLSAFMKATILVFVNPRYPNVIHLEQHLSESIKEQVNVDGTNAKWPRPGAPLLSQQSAPVAVAGHLNIDLLYTVRPKVSFHCNP